MKNNSIENNIKQSFDQFHVDLDHDEIWENIEPHLHHKKRRRLIWFWFLLAGVLVGTWGYRNGWKQQKEMVEVVNSNDRQSIQSDQLQKELTKPEVAAIINQVETKPSSTPSKTEKLSPKNDGGLTNFTHKNTAVESMPEKVSTIAIEAVESEGDPKSPTEPRPDLAEAKTDELPLEHTRIWYHHTKRSHFLLEKKGPREIDPRKQFRKKRRIKPLRKRKWQFFGQATVAPILPIRSLGLNQSNDGLYLIERKETESALEAYGLNFNLQLQHRSNWLFVMGLEYQQFNERFSKTAMMTRAEIEIGIIAVIEDAAGNVIETITGPKLVQTTTEEEMRIHNNYRFWNIPFGVGRAWRKGRWINKLMLGMQYNLGFRVSGTILNENLNPIDLRKRFTSYQEIFRPRLGWGAWISAEFNRSINSRMMLSFAPKLQIPFSKLTVEDYTLSQGYVPISLNIGVSYLLNPPKKRKRGRPNAIN
ncbi:MAG: hypothetical protein AAF985_05220 [Bacteroidota bacterium]